MTMRFSDSLNRGLMLLLVMVMLLSLTACSSKKVVFIYPDELMEFSSAQYTPPAVFIDSVDDIRPLDQRTGQGHFISITYPADDSWGRPVTEIYANALAQDIEQTDLFELVPLRGQADYIISVDLLSFTTELDRSVASFFVPVAVGAGLGMILGDDPSQRLKYGAAAGLLAVSAVPMPTKHRAEAEARITVRDQMDNVIWQEMCLGEVKGKTHIAATSRHDQELVNKYLTKATKRCNACLIAQLRQMSIDKANE